MEYLPCELVMSIIPDPDTLASMLLVCHRINAGLLTAGPFTLVDKETLVVSNKILTFSLRVDGPFLVCLRKCPVRTSEIRMDCDQFHKTFGVPTLLRAWCAKDGCWSASNIGWDRVKYADKFKLMSIKLSQHGNGKNMDSATSDVHYIISHGGLNFYATCVRKDDIDEACACINGTYIIYKKVVY